MRRITLGEIKSLFTHRSSNLTPELKGGWVNIGDEVEFWNETFQISRGSREEKVLFEYFNDFDMERSHYDNEGTQRELFRNTILLLVNYSHDEVIAVIEGAHDNEYGHKCQRVESNVACSRHSNNNNDCNAVLSEILARGGVQCYEDNVDSTVNVEFGVQDGEDVTYVAEMNADIFYRLANHAFSFTVANKGRLCKAGKAYAARVNGRCKCNVDYPDNSRRDGVPIFDRGSRRIVPVASINPDVTGTIEVCHFCSLRHYTPKSNSHCVASSLYICRVL
jgi:hypothetical protein